MLVEIEIMLHVMLAGAVRIQWVDGVILGHGQHLRLAVDGASGRGINNLSNSVTPAALQHVQRSEYVDIGVKHRFLKRLADVGSGGLMANDLRLLLFENPVQQRGTDVDFVEAR
jgi:hypothetical protein